MSCAQTDGRIVMVYASYDVFLRTGLPLEGRDDCTCVIIFSGVIFNRELFLIA